MKQAFALWGLSLLAAWLPNMAVLATEPSSTARPALAATVGRNGETPLKFTTQGEAVVLEVPANFEISRGSIKRLGETWPATIRVRLHLRGLELFAARAGETTVEWSIASSAGHEQHMSLRLGEKQLPLEQESPYYTKVKLVPADPKLPQAGGGFEVTLPAKLFAPNPAEISLFWVDFYRE